jgi:hypothetical protein
MSVTKIITGSGKCPKTWKMEPKDGKPVPGNCSSGIDDVIFSVHKIIVRRPCFYY